MAESTCPAQAGVYCDLVTCQCLWQGPALSSRHHRGPALQTEDLASSVAAIRCAGDLFPGDRLATSLMQVLLKLTELDSRTTSSLHRTLEQFYRVEAPQSQGHVHSEQCSSFTVQILA